MGRHQIIVHLPPSPRQGRRWWLDLPRKRKSSGCQVKQEGPLGREERGKAKVDGRKMTVVRGTEMKVSDLLV